MFDRLFDPSKRLQRRFLRAWKVLHRLESQVERLADEEAQGRARESMVKLVRLAGDLNQRQAHLPMAKGRSFDWLREDFAKTLRKLEEAMEDLQRQIRGLELKPAQPPVTPTPLEPTPAATVTETPAPPAPAAAVPSDAETTPAPVTRVAPVQEKTLPTTPPAGSSPLRQNGSTSRVALRSNGEHEITVRTRQTPEPVRSPEKAAERHACLRTEVAMWIGELNRISGVVSRMERERPEQISSNRWRHLLERVRFRHRSAKEKVGVCKRWLHGDPTLLASRDDWREDFDQAERDLADLRHELESVVAAPQREEQEEAKPQQITTRIKLRDLPTAQEEEDLLKTQLIELPMFRNRE